MDVLLTVGFIALVVVIFVISFFMKRGASFEGDVVDKEVRTQSRSNYGFSIDNYYLKIKTTDGVIKSWQVQPSVYESTMIGDHAVKVKGQSDINISSKTTSSNTPIDASKV